MTTEQKLDKLAEIYNKIEQFDIIKTQKRELLDAEKQKLIDSILTPKMRKQIEEINTEFLPKYEALSENTEELDLLNGSKTMLEMEIQEEVTSVGKSVKGTFINAVYTKPRITWETDKIEGYAVDHPEIAQFRKVGRASVSFRKI